MNTDIETLDLLEKINAGNDEAFTRLAEKYQTVIESTVASFLSTAAGSEDAEALADDMRQEARLALYKAAKRYDVSGAGKSVTFGLYAKICIRNALISDRRRRERQHRKREKLRRRKNEDGASMVRDAADSVVASIELERLAKKADEVLSDMESMIFREIIKGKSAKEISREIGRSAKSVHNAIYRIKSKIKKI